MGTPAPRAVPCVASQGGALLSLHILQIRQKPEGPSWNPQEVSGRDAPSRAVGRPSEPACVEVCQSLLPAPSLSWGGSRFSVRCPE